MIPLNQKSNLQNLKKELDKILPTLRKKIIILLDADRTICEQDSSRLLNEFLGVDLHRIKTGFKKYGYTFRGFYNNSQIYSEIGLEDYLFYSKRVASMISLFPGVFEFINSAAKKADIFLVSSGVKAIWSYVIKNLNLEEKVNILAGLHNDCDNYLIGREEKGFIAEFFSSSRKVISFGDSDVDTLMLLNSIVAIIVVNHRHNVDLLPNIINHPSLFQISYKNYLHEGIKQTTYKKVFDELFNNGTNNYQ